MGSSRYTGSLSAQSNLCEPIPKPTHVIELFSLGKEERLFTLGINDNTHNIIIIIYYIHISITMQCAETELRFSTHSDFVCESCHLHDQVLVLLWLKGK